MVVLAAAVVTKTGKGERRAGCWAGAGRCRVARLPACRARSRRSYTPLQRSCPVSLWI